MRHDRNDRRQVLGVLLALQADGRAPLKALIERLRKAPEVLECHHVAGADSYLLTAAARDLADLERFLASISG